MSCSSSSPCHSSTCHSCSQVNTCYENCGCLNPTDWECVNNPGIHSNIGATNSDNGETVLGLIDTAIGTLNDSVGLVKVNETDTCPETLFEKLEAGTNIALTVTGSGCDRVIVISAGDDIGSAGTDVYSKVSSSDTTTDFLTNKLIAGTYTTKTITNASANEKIKFDVAPSTLISSDSGNQLTIGGDGKLVTAYTAPDGTETKLAAGANITITGVGSISNPYVVSTNAAIQSVRPYFNSTWRDLTFTNGSNGAVAVVSQSVKYRYRFDGTVEFKGNLTYTTTFSTVNKILIVNVATIPVTVTSPATNLTAAEFDRTVNLKSFTTFDTPTTIGTSNLITYNIILNAGGKLSVELNSSTAGTKTTVLTFDGCQFHPNI